MGWLSFYFLFSFSWGLFTLASSQLQSSQFYVLLQIRKHLEYPNQLEIWNTQKTDICYLTPSLQMNVTCSGNSITELRIAGDKPSKISSFDGYPIPNQTLSESFSMDSFFTTLTRLTSLKVVSLVSLGIWGPLPDKIHRLTSLEYLDLSSNFIFGSIPPRISSLSSTLKTLILDGNFLNNTVPDWIGSLSNLVVLSLTNNQLKGPLPNSLGRITSLTSLALSNNEISGELPDLSGLRSLTMLDLSRNKVNSKLPSFPSALVMAFLSNNSFTGEIPKGFLNQLDQLQHLDLSLNQLKGKLPITFFSLPNISYLNLASNSLSGSLPYHLTCGGKLSFVDISNNRLTGGLPKCLSSKVSRFFGNCLTVDVQHQHPGSYCSGEAHIRKTNSKVKGLIVLFVVIGVLAIFVGLLAFGFLVMYRKYCPRGCSEQYLLKNQVIESTVSGVTPELLANARLISQAAKTGGAQGISVCRVFSMEELKEATNNFDKLAYLGEGSRGKVYKGRLQNGTQVAIRCLSLSQKFTIRNLKLRLDLLAKIRHPHLICLLGHCIESNRPGKSETSNMNNVYLVYEYAPHGNLRTYLYDCEGVRALKWPERLTNLVDVAKAVHFLHTGVIPGFFNNRLKMHNILLDENRRAKLSDYGLSVISDEKNTNKVPGNDSRSWQMKMLEDDIYSFGFILLEAIIGASMSTRKDAFLFNEMASLGSEEGRRRMVDPLVLSTSSEESLSIVITITNKCISSDSITRPSFEDVLWNLQYAAQVQTTHDADQRVDSPTVS